MFKEINEKKESLNGISFADLSLFFFFCFFHLGNFKHASTMTTRHTSNTFHLFFFLWLTPYYLSVPDPRALAEEKGESQTPGGVILMKPETRNVRVTWKMLNVRTSTRVREWSVHRKYERRHEKEKKKSSLSDMYKNETKITKRGEIGDEGFHGQLCSILPLFVVMI